MSLFQIGEMDLTTTLSTIGTIVTQFFTWTVDALDVVVTNPILLLGFAGGIVFMVIGMLKRIF